MKPMPGIIIRSPEPAARQVIVLRGKPTIINLLSRHNNKLTVDITPYIFNLAHLSTFIGEASFCSRWQLTQIPRSTQDADTLNYRTLIPNWAIHITTPPSKAQGSLKKRAWKDCKSQRHLVTTRKQCFQTQWGRGAYDSKMVVTPSLRFMQVQVRQHPSVDGRGGQEILSLTKELLIISNFWDGGIF